jgi:large subunit ribosomal protein L22
MLSSYKLKKICSRHKRTIEQMAEQIVRPGLNKKAAVSAVKNWQKGLFKPIPRRQDIEKLASVLSVEVNDISEWCSTYRYAPGSPLKARPVARMIVGRPVQDAMDILKFTKKRSASMINKVLKSAVADADEQQADTDNLYVASAIIDDAGIRIGTKRFRAKDRGRAHAIAQKASHIHVTVSLI